MRWGFWLMIGAVVVVTMALVVLTRFIVALLYLIGCVVISAIEVRIRRRAT